MKNSKDIEHIYEQLSSLYPEYANEKPKANYVKEYNQDNVQITR